MTVLHVEAHVETGTSWCIQVSVWCLLQRMGWAPGEPTYFAALGLPRLITNLGRWRR